MIGNFDEQEMILKEFGIGILHNLKWNLEILKVRRCRLMHMHLIWSKIQ